MQMPLTNARVTYPYGVKDSGYVKGYHTGIDLANSEAVIRACLDGKILLAQYAPGKGYDPTGWGNYVILETSVDKVEYHIIHAHMISLAVKAGQAIAAGTALGVMGSTGNSTGPHLHFEVRPAPWTNRNDIDAAVFLGIKNEKGPVREETKVKNLVIYKYPEDARAAGYLADYLHCPVAQLENQITGDLLDGVETVYQVGWQAVNSRVKLISGNTAVDTAEAVLKFIKGGGE